MDTLCPCGSGRVFEACCQPYLEGWASPPTAEALMRSRFTAYAHGFVDYIGKTSAGEALADYSKKDVAAWVHAATFTKLEVLATENGGAGDDEGLVDFAATYSEAGKVHVLRERSRFAKEGGEWRYVGRAKGQTAHREGPRVGRNDPCPCGSGQKYKKCHGA